MPSDVVDAPQASNEIVFTGHVTQVSYPGGTWRHAVSVGGHEIQVDLDSRHEPPAQVQVRLPHRQVFIFPGSLNGTGVEGPQAREPEAVGQSAA